MENFFQFIAEEVREILAQLGFRTLEEAVGHVECLNTTDAVHAWKAGGLDLSPVLARVEAQVGSTVLHQTREQDHGLDQALDQVLISLAQPALEDAMPVEIDLEVRNVHRTVGTMLGAEVTRRYGVGGLPDKTISIKLSGSGGQSFGAFLPRGIEINLVGDTNDYLGKGLSGGRIIVRPPADARFAPEENIIAGNVIGYGATSGEIFISGQVGERFCVRNSGAIAVVEGIGDHGCEYMTGGRVIILGQTGRNFAAGMSGGVAYVYDPGVRLEKRLNKEMVKIETLEDDDRVFLAAMIARHQELTGSLVASRILDVGAAELERFAKVMPIDYRRVLEATRIAEAAGEDVNAAIMAASNG